MTTRHPASSVGLQWLVTLTVTIATAYAGAGALAAPPVLHPMNLTRWWASSGPIAGAMGILWIAAVLLGGYWLILCTATLVVHGCGREMWLTGLRLPGAGRLLRAVAGASVAGATIVGAAGCGAPPARGPETAPPLLVPVPGATTTAGPSAASGSPETETEIPGPAPSTIGGPPALAGAPTSEETTRWTVKPGEDLWTISASVLSGRLGRHPDDREIAAFWLRVVEVNRPALHDPSNPNLIFAGEVVAVPQ